ncbi:MAG: VOC family protein [Thermoplasmata archaeon]
MALVLTSVAVAVRDRKKAAKWYVEKLGFRVKDDDQEHWMTVTDPRRTFRLHLCEMAGPGRKPKKSELGNTGIMLVTREPIRTVYARLKKKGVKFSQPPKEFPWGWVAKFLDRDGNEFWLTPAY